MVIRVHSSMIIHISVFTFTNDFEEQAAQRDVFSRFTTFANEQT